MIDVIPPDATIMVVRAIPRDASKRSNYAEFHPGEVFMFVDDFDLDEDEFACIAVALSSEAVDVFECEGWRFERPLTIFAEDVDPVDDELDAVIRAAVALIGEMPIDTDCLLSALSNQPVIG